MYYCCKPPSLRTTHFKNRAIPITFRTAIVCVLIWFGICTIPFAFRTAIICVLIWFRICSITLAFRRASVCVCLVGFASLQSPWAHTLRRPCLACPSRCTKPFHSHNHLKRTSIPRSTPHSPQKNKKIRHLSKQRILYIQFSAIVKMVSGSKAIMFYGTHSTSP